MNTEQIKKRLAFSVIAQIAGQLFASILGVVILKVLTNYLGPGNYGIYTTCIAFVTSFAILTELGLNTVTVREISKHPEDAEVIVSQNMGLRIFLSVIMIPLIFGLSFLFYPHADKSLRFGILILSTYLFFDSIWATTLSYFGSKVRGDVSGMLIALQQALFFISVIVLASIGWGLFGFIAAYVVTIAVCAAVVFYMVKHNLKSLRPRISLSLWRKFFAMSVAIGAMSVISSIYAQVDKILISLLIGTTAVGIYSVAYSLISALLSLPVFIMGGLTPSMTTATKGELKQIIQKAFNYMVVLACLMLVGSIVLRDDAILTISSRKYLAAALPFAILATATVFSYLKTVLIYAAVAISKHHKIVYVFIGSLLLNIGLNLALIPRYGIVGAAYSVLISEIFTLLWINKIFYNATSIRIKLRPAAKPILAMVIVFLLSTVLKEMWSTSNALINIAIGGMVLSISYFSLLYLLNGLPEEIKSFVDRVSVVLFRRIKSLLVN